MQARAYLLGEDVDPDRVAVTTGQWLDLWLQMRSVGFSTRRIYAQHIHDYVQPHLGSVPLRQLTTGRVQAMFTSLLRTPGVQGKPLSMASLHKIRGVLHAALNGAIRRGLIDRNPRIGWSCRPCDDRRRWCGPRAGLRTGRPPVSDRG